MATGRRQLERSARPLLAAHVGEIGQLGLAGLVGRLGRRRLQLAAEIRDRLAEVPHGNRFDAAELGFARGLGSAEDPFEPRPSRSLRNGESAANGPHPPVERKLAHRGVLREPLSRDLPGRGEDCERDREVEAGALLAQPRRREVDRDSLQRPFELGGADPAADAVLRLGAGAVGEPDDREAGEAAVDVRLDLDPPRLQPDERVGDGAREHTSRLRRAHAPKVTVQRQIRIDS